MSSSSLRIRVRCPTAVCPTPIQLEGCTPQTTFAEFLSIISTALGFSESEEDDKPGLSVLAGFPPRPLEMAGDDKIGSKLSDNENVTVRLPSQASGIQQGGKWGRSKRSKTSSATVTTSSTSTRSSSRASKPAVPSTPIDGARTAGGGSGRAGGSNGSTSSPQAGARASNKTGGKQTSAAGGKLGGGGGGRRGGGGGDNNRIVGAAVRGLGAGLAPSNGTIGSRTGGGVHTLGGPLTTPAASPRSSGASPATEGGRGGRHPASGAGGPPPGQVRTVFGDSTSPTRGRATGSDGSNPTAAAALRRAGTAAPTDGSPPPSSARQAGESSTAVAAAAVAAAAGEPGRDGRPNRKRPRGGRGIQLRSEGDIAERLLAAVGGGGKGTADRFFRKAMKLAVDKQYDQSRADARVRAALGGWYTAEASTTQRRLGDGESVALDVSFSKGPGTKTQLTETVDRIPREQVAAVVRMIARDPESREMLKPHNFAGCSPRMFWSLVQHWGGDVPRALRLAAPDVDWNFVDTRDRKPSEKAVANAAAKEAERQAAEQERIRKEKVKRKRERRKRRKEGVVTDSSDEEERPADAEAMSAADAGGSRSAEAEELEATRATAAAADAAIDARRRAANAALARLTASQQRPAAAAAVGAAGLATAVPPARSSEGIAADREDEKVEEREEETEIDVESLAEIAGELGCKLLVAAGVRSLEQLADRDEEELARELVRLDQEAGGNLAAEAGGEASGGGGGDRDGGTLGTGERVSAEQVSEWVQAARGEELDEIMASILGDDEDVIEALEEVSVSTPRDLVRLGAFPDVLVGVVRDRLGEQRFAPLADRITAEKIEVWRRKGDRLLEQRPWLELWVHEG